MTADKTSCLLCSLSPALQASIIDEAALGMVSGLVACKVLSTALFHISQSHSTKHSLMRGCLP